MRCLLFQHHWVKVVDKKGKKKWVEWECIWRVQRSPESRLWTIFTAWEIKRKDIVEKSSFPSFNHFENGTLQKKKKTKKKWMTNTITLNARYYFNSIKFMFIHGKQTLRSFWWQTEKMMKLYEIICRYPNIFEIEMTEKMLIKLN